MLKNAFALLILCAACAYPQAGLGSINGTVVDSSGAVIVGAAVSLVETNTQQLRNTITNEAGLFTFPSTLVGSYEITIKAAGFKEKKLSNLTLNAFQQMALGQIPLEVGEGPAAVVTVTAEQQLVKDSAVRYDTIQSAVVADMPLNGRNWATLLKALPGANPANRNAYAGREYSYDGYGDFRVNGKNGNQTQVNLDGGDIVDHGNDTKTTVAPSLEAIQEVSVLANNFQAEYGNKGGMVVNIITKSGSNDWRGTAWNHMRNEALNANDWDRNFQGLPRRPYKYNYFGANLSGPIRKNKMFFFYNYEKYKQSTPPGLRTGRVPDQYEREGDFSRTLNANGTRPVIYEPGSQFSGAPKPLANNILPKSFIDPLGYKIMQLMPKPNFEGNLSYNHIFQYDRKFPRFSNVGKFDWNIGDKARAYVRYSEDGGTMTEQLTWVADTRDQSGIVLWHRPDRALTGNFTAMPTPTFVNESMFNWTFDYPNTGLEDSLNPQGATKKANGLSDLPLAFPVWNDVLPQITGTGYVDFNYPRFPWYARLHVFQGTNTSTWTRGSHIVKLGFQFISNYKDEIDGSNYKGSFNFGASTSEFDTGYSPANLLVGAVQRFQQTANMHRKYSIYRDYHAFIQDTWKITSNLTLDFGVRFYHIPTEYNTRPKETLDAAFFPDRWDPAKAPRIYVPHRSIANRIVDPAFPDQLIPSHLTSVLRYSLVPGSGDPNNGVVPLGAGGIPRNGIPNPSWLLFAPRAGFAWSPLGDRKTVIRGGFGWAYNRNTITDAVNGFENRLADIADYRMTSLRTLSSPTTVKVISARSFNVQDSSNFHLPLVIDYSLTIQRELPWNLVLDTGYVGNIQRHQPVNMNINTIAPGVAHDPKYIDPANRGYNLYGPVSNTNLGALPGSNTMDSLVMRPYTGMNTLTLTNNAANNRYHSWQTSLSKRFGHGLTLMLTHTWAHTFSGQENVGLYVYNWRDYTGFTLGVDRRHVVNINYIYDLPKFAQKIGSDNRLGRALFNDWQIAQMLMFFTGQNFSPGYSLQYASTNQGVGLNSAFVGTPDLAPREVVVGNANAPSNKDFAHVWNPAAIYPAPAYPAAVGMGSRNYLSGYGTFNNDITLTKEFKVKERYRLEVRTSFFNAFNQVRRTGYNSSVTFKANGATYAQGFTIFNTPELNVERLRAQGVTDPIQLYNSYRGGVGHMNVTGVEPMRIIEIGLRFRF
jgi:hypothetical protein